MDPLNEKLQATCGSDFRRQSLELVLTEALFVLLWAMKGI